MKSPAGHAQERDPIDVCWARVRRTALWRERDGCAADASHHPHARLAPHANGAPRPKSQAVIDHVCYTVADFNREVPAELTALGATNVRNAGTNSVYATDPMGYEIQISGLASTALGGGG
jgi:hypothetical protein